jgi:hypothetical protein
MRYRPATERRHTCNAGLREHFRQLEARWNRVHPSIPVADLRAVNGTVRDEDALSLLALSDDWRRVLETKRPNVIVIGPPTKVTPVLTLLARSVAQPMVSCTARNPVLPETAVGTLVLHDADRLTRLDQDRVYGWLSCAVDAPQVITTTSVPLFPLVMRNAFSDALFYRLNVVCLTAV